MYDTSLAKPQPDVAQTRATVCSPTWNLRYCPLSLPQE